METSAQEAKEEPDDNHRNQVRIYRRIEYNVALAVLVEFAYAVGEEELASHGEEDERYEIGDTSNVREELGEYPEVNLRGGETSPVAVVLIFEPEVRIRDDQSAESLERKEDRHDEDEQVYELSVDHRRRGKNRGFGLGEVGNGGLSVADH